MKEAVRLDQALVDRGLFASRERAKAAVMSGIVYVGGQKATKAGTPVAADAEIELRGKDIPYVSRGGLKIEKALKVFDFDPAGMRVIDVGASTGGFTDCLLQNGAAHVWCVDVGYGQLAWTIRNDPRVTVMERTNIRYVTPDMIGESADLAVIDVSFISLGLVLPPVKALLKDGGQCVALVKPQFEAGRGKVGKKGVVRDPAVHKEVLDTFLEKAKASGFYVKALDFSPIRGPEGNIEYLAHLVTTPYETEFDTAELVRCSHEAHGTDGSDSSAASDDK